MRNLHPRPMIAICGGICEHVGSMLFLYRLLTHLAGPLLPWLLRRRLKHGKEDPLRWREKLGDTSGTLDGGGLQSEQGEARERGGSEAAGDAPRQKTKLLWVHAASMGESLSALPLIEAFLARHPGWQVLVTTVTVTSARAMAEKLPPRALHQFAPLDHPGALARFLARWQPEACLWVESELWPNMLLMAKKSGCEIFLVNARMSDRSFRRWRLAGPLIRPMLRGFTAVFAQSGTDAERFRQLGAARVERLGNLKYDTPPLPCDEAELGRLRESIGARPLWLAASTHEGEEILIAEAHRALVAEFPTLLTVIVPRHATRGEGLAAQLCAQGLPIARRSQNEPLTPETQVYLADTMGELGLFYRLSPLAFLGGSLVPHGGQNLLEAARLGCALLTGPHTENFTAICDDLLAANALMRVADPAALHREVAAFLRDPQAARAAGERARQALENHHGVIERLLDQIEVAL